jgi:CHAT domain-containing protein
MRIQSLLLLAAAAAAAGPAVAAATAPPISLRDSFRLGSGSGVLCSVESRATDPALKTMFDRGYAIVCRDAAVPVGQLYVLKADGGAAVAAPSDARCGPSQTTKVDDLAGVAMAECTLAGSGVAYRLYSLRKGDRLYAARGLGGYDSALRLGLRTLVADRPVPGEVTIATTQAGDPAAFARVQAGSLDPQRALTEAYRRNNSGSYAEAAEFFATLIDRNPASRGEALANAALQQSNLGHYGEADIFFARAGATAGSDPVLARMVRNYRAMDLLNRQRPDDALAELANPLPAGAALAGAAVRQLIIDTAVATQLNSESAVAARLDSSSDTLTQPERAAILDGQADDLRGTALRIEGRPAEAASALNSALARLSAVREGRVASTIWMRAQIYDELAAIAESAGNAADAERQHQLAVSLLSADYPGSSALLSAQARLAGFYARTGKTEQATTLFRQVVDANAENGDSSTALRRSLAPYFALLARNSGRSGAVADMFKASQVLVRPGVAQTQAVLARELSGGSDEAARLFRQSVTLTRDIERMRVEVSRLSALTQATPDDTARLQALKPQLEEMEKAQVATQAKLAQFPRYRAVSGGAMTLADLQKVLRPGEAYFKMILVGEEGYGIFATPDSARAFPLGVTASELDRQVDSIRDTVSKTENGHIVTYPFDIRASHKLFEELMTPVAGELAAVRHLIFEPDGGMLRLPPNLLVTDKASVDSYLARASRAGDDGFDFTGVKWLGRERDISTAVSARSFRDVRQVAPSHAAHDYIGFGQNEPAQNFLEPPSGTRSVSGAGADCSWSPAAWSRPISAQELYLASQIIDPKGGSDTAIVTGKAFSDTAIKQRPDLSQYRIMHFATHGLVTAPRPECPARPALMTSFGGAESDGLLTFAEIFDLRIDADLVILSACDTAGKASAAATREAGLTTGGDFALDGLVRAFVGAGGRSVIASHWPVPDDYGATKKLISGLFTAPPGTATATALRRAQNALMDARETSHPYYWSGFAIIGDGEAPVLTRSSPAQGAAKGH